MKANTALIEINEVKTFKILLIPETDEELEFLKQTANIDDLNFHVTWQNNKP